MDRERARLVEHVRSLQRTIRTCEGCGLCCTEPFNSVRILPVEARRVALHLKALPRDRAADLVARIRESIANFRLKPGAGLQSYTCPFLEPDASCALPFDVKPVACLAFNPVTSDRCDMDVGRFDRAHRAAEDANESAGLPPRRSPIPVAVLSAWEEPSGESGSKAGSAAAHPLPRILSKWHVASRSKAEELVRSGRVTVNGTPVRDVTRRVRPGRDRIAVDGSAVGRPDRAAYSYVLFNKPRGTISTTSDPEGRQTVLDHVRDLMAPGLAPVGRLDRDSAGLLLLTNDHELAATLLDPASHVRKVYRVKVKGHVTPETMARMRTEAVESDGLSLAPVEVEVESVGPRSTWLRIVLEEGKNRQIRRQCGAFGHEVELIVRMTFGPLELGALRPGASRRLTEAEIASLRGAAR